MKKNFFEMAMDLLQVAIDKHSSARALAEASGVTSANISRWKKGTQKPRLDEISKILDLLGAQIVLPDDNAAPDKDVCFVEAKVMPAGEHASPPLAEDYIAAPLVGEVGAGPGYLPEEDIKSWFLCYKNLPAVRMRRNLIAVEIGGDSRSMQPTLNPGDIVLIDRDDRDVTHDGHMMLVLDPLDGSGMIKRVSVRDVPGDVQITYYSDNASQYPPSVYRLNEDFLGDWDKSIVGRVIWAWSDVRNK